MRKFTLYHALLIVLIIGIGLLVWQTVLLHRAIANQTATLEQAIDKAATKQLDATQKSIVDLRSREGRENAMPVYVVNPVRVR